MTKFIQDQRQRDDNDLSRIGKETRSSPMKELLPEAIKSEIDSILQNHTWELVDLLSGCKPLGYKWIFKKKMKADGTIDKYKARLGFAAVLAVLVTGASQSRQHGLEISDEECCFGLLLRANSMAKRFDRDCLTVRRLGCTLKVEHECEGNGEYDGEMGNGYVKTTCGEVVNVLQRFWFHPHQWVSTLIFGTLDGLDVGLLGDVIGEDDCDDDG
ncbi:calcineurin B-like protein 4 [Tanacetum coccineum]